MPTVWVGVHCWPLVSERYYHVAAGATHLLYILAARLSFSRCTLLGGPEYPNSCAQTLGQLRDDHLAIHLSPHSLPSPPVNMSLSDGKVNKFCSRLKVLIISFVNNK